MEPAPNPVFRVETKKRRLFLQAPVENLRASGVEPATLGRMDEARRLAFDRFKMIDPLVDAERRF
jgi:hypothetical protein